MSSVTHAFDEISQACLFSSTSSSSRSPFASTSILSTDLLFSNLWYAGRFSSLGSSAIDFWPITAVKTDSCSDHRLFLFLECLDGTSGTSASRQSAAGLRRCGPAAVSSCFLSSPLVYMLTCARLTNCPRHSWSEARRPAARWTSISPRSRSTWSAPRPAGERSWNYQRRGRGWRPLAPLGTGAFWASCEGSLIFSCFIVSSTSYVPEMGGPKVGSHRGSGQRLEPMASVLISILLPEIPEEANISHVRESIYIYL